MLDAPAEYAEDSKPKASAVMKFETADDVDGVNIRNLNWVSQSSS